MRYIIYLIVMLMLPIISFGQNENDNRTTYVSNCKCNKDSLNCSYVNEGECTLINPEVFPEFPGGSKELLLYVHRNFKIPQETLDAGLVSGRIGITFIIEKDGSITDIKIVRPVEEHFDKEFVAVFKNLPKWKPGKDKGNVVRTKMRWYMNYGSK